MSYKEDILMSWDDFLAIGKEEYEKNRNFLNFANSVLPDRLLQANPILDNYNQLQPFS